MSFPPNRGFTTTRWTLVLKADRGSTPASRAALTELCDLYWPPLYAYARRKGSSVEDAQDLTQAFFAQLLEKHYVRAADPERGKFRSFLLASFKHFAAHERDREQAQKRGGGQVPLTLDFDRAEAGYTAEPPDTLTPEALFERQWALGVLDRVLATLRAECVKSGKEATFDNVKDLLVGEKSPGGYAAIAATLGTTEGAIKVTVHRLRRRYQQALRAEIGATVSDDSEIDEEIRYLIALLSEPHRPSSLPSPR
jgi:RNA polymerase sigma factor (sigma-70 family)